MYDPHAMQLLLEIRSELASIKRSLRGVTAKLNSIWVWGQRGSLLIAIWLGAIWANLTADDKASLLAAAFQVLIGR